MSTPLSMCTNLYGGVFWDLVFLRWQQIHAKADTVNTRPKTLTTATPTGTATVGEERMKGRTAGVWVDRWRKIIQQSKIKNKNLTN